MVKKGQNSVDDDEDRGGVAAERLRSGIERIERLAEERKGLGDDIKDIFAELKSAGFDVQAVKTIIKRRKAEPADLAEQAALVGLYSRALGMELPEGDDGL